MRPVRVQSVDRAKVSPGVDVTVPVRDLQQGPPLVRCLLHFQNAVHHVRWRPCIAPVRHNIALAGFETLAAIVATRGTAPGPPAGGKSRGSIGRNRMETPLRQRMGWRHGPATPLRDNWPICRQGTVKPSGWIFAMILMEYGYPCENQRPASSLHHRCSRSY